MSASSNPLNFRDVRLFGNEAGEEEDADILASYFLDQPAFTEFFDRNTRLRFARARKGMGKSALLSKLGHDLLASPNDYLVVRVTGSDLTGLGEFSSPDPAVLVNQWQQVICARITQEIGASIGLAITDSEMLMVEMSELSGFKDRNVLRSLVDRLTAKIAGNEVALSRPTAANPAELLRRYQDGRPRTVWLLVDDVDSTFIDRHDQKLKIGTFFSACRKLAREVSELNIRASVRTDVWWVIRDNEDLDKCEQYMTDVRWSKVEMGVMLAKRISAYVQRNKLERWSNLSPEDDTNHLVELAFARRIRWGGSLVPPIRALNILSARRPRWLAQLCGRAGREAAKRGDERITTEHLIAVLKAFGDLRLNDLKKEHGHQFDGLLQLVNAFALGPRTYTTAELKERIQKKYLAVIARSGVPRLDGTIVREALDLARFLFRIGFIQGQSGDGDFVDFEDRPDLLESGVNADDGLVWAIYPSYRNVLRIN